MRMVVTRVVWVVLIMLINPAILTERQSRHAQHLDVIKRHIQLFTMYTCTGTVCIFPRVRLLSRVTCFCRVLKVTLIMILVLVYFFYNDSGTGLTNATGWPHYVGGAGVFSC